MSKVSAELVAAQGTYAQPHVGVVAHAPAIRSARMTEARSDITRAAVLRGPREVAEDEAGPSVAALYSRLRELLGVPFVPTVFRMLAVHEDYLAAVVDAASGTPAERRETYARRGVELAARVARQLEPGSVSAGEGAGAIRAVLDRYNVANPAGMLILAALSDGLEPAPVLVAPLPERAGRSLQDDVLMCHGGFTVPGLWRELAHGWPDVAERAWTEIRSLAQAPGFASGRDDLVALASEAIPATTFPRADVDPDVERIVTWFARAIPTMVLEIECLRLALGPADPPR